MPLLYEINDKQDSILCFVPSGHLTEEGFTSFPPQLGNTCWHHAQQMLVSMCYTQKPFDIDNQDDVVQEINNIKCELGYIAEMAFFAKELFWLLYTRKSKNKFKVLGSDNSSNYCHMLVNDEYNGKEKHSFLTLCRKEPFLNYCKEIALTINTIINASKKDSENGSKIDDSITKYFLNVQIRAIESRFTFEPLMQQLEISTPGIASIKNCPNEQKIGHYLMSLKIANLKNLDFRESRYYNVLSLSPECKKNIIRNQLLNKGPFLIEGKIGVPYYRGVKPNVIGNFGSLSLLGFNANAYNPDTDRAHMVLVIGMHQDKVIYLDPLVGNKVDQRQAYIMSIDKFIERTIAHQQENKQEALNLYYVEPEKIDTTMDLMESQTAAVTKNKIRLR